FASPVEVHGQGGADAMFLKDQGDANANYYSITATDVYRNGAAILNYEGADSLTLYAGNYDDEAVVQSTLATTPATLKMGFGDDSVAVGSGSTFATTTLDAILGALTVDGQDGWDMMTLYDQGTTPQIPNDTGTGYIPVDYTITATTVSRTRVAPVTY